MYLGSDQDKGEKWYFDAEYDHKGERRMPGLASLDSHSLHWNVYDDKDSDLNKTIDEPIDKINDRMLFVLKTVGHQDHSTNNFEDSAVVALFDEFAVKFWNSVFSLTREKETMIKKVLRSALNGNFLFRGVELRKQLCDAMYRREEAEMKEIIAIIEI